MRRMQAVVLALTALLVSQHSSLAQACNSDLHSLTSDPYGYRARGNRCEGIYIRDLSASLRIVSFTRSFDAFNADDSSLHLSWPIDTSQETHLRATGLRPQLYYEMDTVQPKGVGSYDWDTGLLQALGITRPELGIVGWEVQEIGGKDRQVYLPLAVTTSRSNKNTLCQFILVSGVEIRELYVTVSLLDKDGSRLDTLRKQEPLKAGYYPADVGISIPVPELKKPGLYLLELGAEFEGGGVSTETVWFRYDG